MVELLNTIVTCLCRSRVRARLQPKFFKKNGPILKEDRDTLLIFTWTFDKVNSPANNIVVEGRNSGQTSEQLSKNTSICRVSLLLPKFDKYGDEHPH